MLRPIAEKIEHVYLDNNDIASISNLYDILFRVLGYIDFRQNNISVVKVNRLILPALIQLRLESNMLMSLDDVSHCGWGTLKPKIEDIKIYLSDNPWHCDKRLVWLSAVVNQDHREHMTHRKNVTFTIVDGHLVTCVSPPSFQGRSIDTISKLCANNTHKIKVNLNE